MALRLAHPIPDGQSLRAERGRSHAWPFMIHGHACYELIHISAGEGGLVVGGHEGRFAPGTCVLLAPMLAHSFHAPEPQPGGELLAMEIVYFADSLVDPGDVPELSPLLPLLTRARQGVRFAPPTSAGIRAQLEGLIDCAFAPERVLRLLALLRHLAEAGGESLAVGDAPSPYRDEDLERLERLHDLLRRRFRDPLTLPEVARELGVSPSTVNHLLFRHARTTFLRQLSQLRLDEAKRLLRDSDLDITSIAFSSGFGSLATFNRRFRASVGVAPHLWRAQPRSDA